MVASDVLALHTGCLGGLAVPEQFELAQGAGFGAVELQLDRALRTAHQAGPIRDRFAALPVVMLDAVLGAERFAAAPRRQRLEEARRAVACCRAWGSPRLQVVVLDDLHDDHRDRRAQVATALGVLADVAGDYGVRLAVEPVVFSRFQQLPEVVEVLDGLGWDRVGLVLDVWHLWASDTAPEQIADLVPAQIACVHLSDAGPKREDRWRDDDRWPPLGDGLVPLTAWAGALVDRGFEGTWTIEMFRSWDSASSASSALADQRLRAERLIAAARAREHRGGASPVHGERS